MARIETWFTQDLKKIVKVRYVDGNVFSGDGNGNVVGVELLDDGEPAVVSGSVSAYIIRSDGNTVVATGSLSGNKASVILPQSAYAVPGTISIVVKITSGSDVSTVCAIVSNVYRSSTDAVVDPGTIIPSIDALIEEINEAVASIPLDYSSLNKLMHSTITGGVSQFKFSNLLLKLVPKTGYYVNYTSGIEVENSSYQYYTVPSPGSFVISGGGGNTHVAYFDKTGAYIGGDNPTWQDNYAFTPPVNCAYFTYSLLISDSQYLTVISDTGVRSMNNRNVASLMNTHVNIGNMPDMVKPKKNLFNKYAAIHGGFIDYSGQGDFVANNDYYFCPWFIPAKPSTTYCPNAMCLVAEYDENYNWIKCNNLTTLVSVQPFTTSSSCRYVRISVRSLNGFQLEEGSSVTAYSPFQMEFVGNTETEAQTRTIVVNPDGSGNYTTITEACGAANDGDTIYICDGVYYESLKINGLNVHLVGESREGTILKYLGTQYANPPLEMSNGSIENMTIWAITEQGASGGGGYCLHCDNEASANGYLTCRNVKFQNDYYQVIGIGLQPNFTLSFENCEFIGQVYVHDCAKTFSDLTGQVIRFIDCAIHASNQPLGAIRMQSQERSGAHATALFQRCIVKNDGSNVIVHMGLWEDTGLAKDGWLGSTDWHLDGMSIMNNKDVLNAE